MNLKMQLIKKSEFDRINEINIPIYYKLGIIADMCRFNTLIAVKKAGSGHLGSSLSSMEIVVWLYYKEMNTINIGINSQDRDIYFSSKGHDVPGLYSVLHSLGVLSDDKLLSLRRLNGIDGHPDVGVNGIEANTGSLGMGISKAKGMAWAKQYKKLKGHVFVMTGDGEFQEGQNFEALQTAVQQKIYGFTVIMDHNKVQSDKPLDQIVSLGDLKAKIESFGWEVIRIDGNDLISIEAAFEYRKKNSYKNIFIIADTIKGKGVSFMEHPQALTNNKGLYPWHAGAPDDTNFEKAMMDIDKVAFFTQRQLGRHKLNFFNFEIPTYPNGVLYADS
jgi:transketolase